MIYNLFSKVILGMNCLFDHKIIFFNLRFAAFLVYNIPTQATIFYGGGGILTLWFVCIVEICIYHLNRSLKFSELIFFWKNSLHLWNMSWKIVLEYFWRFPGFLKSFEMRKSVQVVDFSLSRDQCLRFLWTLEKSLSALKNPF